MKKSSIYTVLLICFPIILRGQEMNVLRISTQPLDSTAFIHPCYDLNGDTCALVKIKTNHIENIQFTNPNQYTQISYDDGVYSVYLPSISRKLDLQHKDYIPLQINFVEYGYRRLKKGMTYLAILEVPQINEIRSSVIFKVSPANSVLIFDKNEYRVNTNGIVEIPVTAGQHNYMVSSDNYLSHNSSITIGNSEAKTVTVSLLPIMHDVLIESNVRNARVLVDNIDYGEIGKLSIPQGMHSIRVQAVGYIDLEQTVNICSTTGHLSFVLNKNQKTVHIHATPVTIYASNTPCIFINNKKIKEWTNGATIMLLPGSYSVSAFERGRCKDIVVGSEPMVIEL